jgi:hypothetical protein
MKVVLVNPPRSSYDLTELGPPLGLLKLGTVAREAGAEVSIIDLNLLWHLDEKLASLNFFERATELLLAEDADLYGFTSMGIDSHIGLELAKLVKSHKGNALCVLGGPHFSSIAADVRRLFDWVDIVIEGEGETQFRHLVLKLCGPKQVDSKTEVVPGNPRRKSEVPQPTSVDYDLVDLSKYFLLNPVRVLDFEGGRGCVFKCAFCYSPTHYERVLSFQLSDRLEQIEKLNELGARHLFFVEDNFLNNKADALEFCREMESLRTNLTWTCYATFPQLDEEMITWMARAGCSAVFSGIDAVGKASTNILRKSFYRGARKLEEKVRQCTASGITPTLAFLLSPPSVSCGVDFEETLKAALIARNSGALVRLNTLAFYNNTPTMRTSRLTFDSDALRTEMLFDVPPVVSCNTYSSTHPQLFPFHSRYVKEGEWREFVFLMHGLFTLLHCLPKTVAQLWEDKQIGPIEIAQRVLDEIGNLLSIQKQDRRIAEASAAVSIIDSLTRTASVQYWLEREVNALS